MILSKDKIMQTLKENNFKLKELGVERIALFGSFSKGTQLNDSDIDFLVSFKKNISYVQELKLGIFLKKLFKRNIDVGTFEELKEGFREEILSQNLEELKC